VRMDRNGGGRKIYVEEGEINIESAFSLVSK
jgi:hypothetical protein